MGAVSFKRMSIFQTVVEAGSLSAAARRLGLTKGAVSQQLKQLESDIGVPLLVRSTRKLSMTEAGERFLSDAAVILRDANDAYARAAGGRDDPTGTLRVAAGGDFGARFVAPVLAEFQKLHPRLRIDLDLSDETRNVVEGGFDVAIRGGRMSDSSLKATKVMDFESVVVASPEYLARHGHPESVEELADHPWIAQSVLRSPLTWSFQGPDGETTTIRVRATVQVNSAAAARAFLLAGTAITALPDILVNEDIVAGRLVHLCPDHHLAGQAVYAVFAATRFMPAKTRLFIEYLKPRLKLRRAVVPR